MDALEFEYDRILKRFKTKEGFIATVAIGGMDALCGYIELPPKHRLFGKSYNHKDFSEIEVHGGITWSERRYPWDQKRRKSYVIGFDCLHYGDCIPGFISDNNKGIYRDEKFVTKELKSLSRQIKNGK